MQNTARRYLICDKCQGKAHMTLWKPGIGLDPELRRFECKDCDHRRYQRIPLDEQGAYEK